MACNLGELCDSTRGQSGRLRTRQGAKKGRQGREVLLLQTCGFRCTGLEKSRLGNLYWLPRKVSAQVQAWSSGILKSRRPVRLVDGIVARGTVMQGGCAGHREMEPALYFILSLHL